MVIPPTRPISRCRSAATQHRTDETLMSNLLCPFCRKIMISEREPLLLECGHSFCKSCVSIMPVFESSRPKFDLETPLRKPSDGSESDSGKAVSVSSMLASLMFRRKADMDQPQIFSAHQHQLHKEHGEGFGYLRCLECREKTHMTRAGIADLQVNSFLGTAADKLVYKMSICAECENAPTRKYCEECTMSLCPPCSKRIHSGVITSQHHVIDFLDMKNLPQSATYAPVCQQHPREESVLYCISCEELACVLCAYGSHKKHDISLLTDAIGNLKLRLQSRAQNANEKVALVSMAKQGAHFEMQRLRENSVAAQAFTLKKVSEVINVLKKVESEMIAAIKDEEQRKHEQLSMQHQQLESIESDMKLRVQLASKMIKNPNAAEIIEPISNQIKVLDKALNDLPSLSLCSSAIIQVGMEKIVEKMENMILELEDERFPRCPSNISTVTGSGRTESATWSPSDSIATIPTLIDNSSGGPSTESLPERITTEKPLARKVRDGTPKLREMEKVEASAQVLSDTEHLTKKKRQKVHTTKKKAVDAASARFQDVTVDLTADESELADSIDNLPLSQVKQNIENSKAGMNKNTAKISNEKMPEEVPAPVTFKHLSSKREQMKTASEKKEFSVQKAIIPKIEEDDSDTDSDVPEVGWMLPKSQPVPGTSSTRLAAPIPGTRFVNFDALKRNLNS